MIRGRQLEPSRVRGAGGLRRVIGLAALVAAGCAIALGGGARADDEAEDETAAVAVAPADEYERGTPRAAMRGYLVACRDGDFERAAHYLDLRRIPPGEREGGGPELARRLKIVLDRTLWVELDALSDDPNGFSDDGLPWFRDLVGVVQAGSGPVSVFLDRVPRDDGVRVWEVSGATVAQIPKLYEEFGLVLLDRYLPQVLVDFQLAEVALWQWIGLLVAIVLAYGLSILVAGVLLSLSRPLVRRSVTDVDDRLLAATAGPLRLLAALVLFHLLTLPLGLAVPARRFLVGVENTIAILAVAWLLFRLLDVVGRHVETRLLARGQAGAIDFVPLGRKTVKAFVAIAAFLAALDSFGFNVWGFVAGLGVGGIAVALAAQKTIENFFGGVFLLADRPVRPGDFCRFGDKIGTVEDVGLRSTRVRTLDRTVVTIPNAEFSSLQLENFALRDRIRFHTVLGLRYETEPDQLRHVLAGIRRLLLSHPRVNADPARVRFVGFGAYSLDLEIFAYVNTSDWAEFLAIREDLLLRLMDVVAQSGTGFAFPSQTHYLAKDDGLDGERTRLALEEIHALREKRELPLPDYPEDAKAGFDDSLDYPPEGSALRRD